MPKIAIKKCIFESTDRAMPYESKPAPCRVLELHGWFIWHGPICIFMSFKNELMFMTIDDEIYGLILGNCNFLDIFCSWQLKNYYTYFGANGGEKLYWICRCRDESFSFEVSVLLNNGGFTFWSLVNRVP